MSLISKARNEAATWLAIAGVSLGSAGTAIASENTQSTAEALNPTPIEHKIDDLPSLEFEFVPTEISAFKVFADTINVRASEQLYRGIPHEAVIIFTAGKMGSACHLLPHEQRELIIETLGDNRPTGLELYDAVMQMAIETGHWFNIFLSERGGDVLIPIKYELGPIDIADPALSLFPEESHPDILELKINILDQPEFKAGGETVRGNAMLNRAFTREFHQVWSNVMGNSSFGQGFSEEECFRAGYNNEITDLILDKIYGYEDRQGHAVVSDAASLMAEPRVELLRMTFNMLNVMGLDENKELMISLIGQYGRSVEMTFDLFVEFEKSPDFAFIELAEKLAHTKYELAEQYENREIKIEELINGLDTASRTTVVQILDQLTDQQIETIRQTFRLAAAEIISDLEPLNP